MLPILLFSFFIFRFVALTVIKICPSFYYFISIATSIFYFILFILLFLGFTISFLPQVKAYPKIKESNHNNDKLIENTIIISLYIFTTLKLIKMISVFREKKSLRNAYLATKRG
jgi:ABC-type multidrug transport system fused ATPase/permease subunit